MRMNKRIAILLIIGFQLSAPALIAQNPDETFNESVTVTGTYRPEIKEFDKINIAPQIADTSTAMRHKFSYEVSTTRLTSLYSPTRIKAAKIIGEPTSRLYNSYVRLGFGNYWSPLAEIYYNSTRSKKINYGVFATHNSSWGTIGKRKKGVDFPGTYYGKNHFSQTGVTAFGKFIVGDKVQLATDLSFENDYNLYYGFNDSTLHANDSLVGFGHSATVNYRDSLKVKDYRALYNRLAWNFGVKDLSTEALGYSANIKVSNLWALYKQNELNINLDGDVHYAFNVGKKKKHKAIAYLHLMWDGYYGTVNPSASMTMPLGYSGAAPTSQSAFRNLFDINPYVDFLFGSFKLHAGFLSNIENFSNADSTRFHIYPDVELSKSFLKEALNLSLGAVGAMDANSLDVIRQVNPYVGPYSTMRGTSHYDFYLRMRVNFSKKLEMKLYGEFNMFTDDLCFQLDTNYVLRNVYEPLYLKYNRVKAGGSFSFVNDEMLNISLGGNYYYYTDKTLPYRPDFDAFFSAKFNYHDKWLFGIQALVVGKMRGSQPTADGSVETLPLRYGISAELEYRHNRALSFFIKADNLAYQRYYLWSNYPSQRITFLAGVTYTILTKKR